MKNARRRPTKCENRRKMPVVGRRNAGFAENHSSSVDESEKETKDAFHPRLKLKKRQKSTFRHGGRVENSKNCISAMAEE